LCQPGWLLLTWWKGVNLTGIYSSIRFMCQDLYKAVHLSAAGTKSKRYVVGVAQKISWRWVVRSKPAPKERLSHVGDGRAPTSLKPETIIRVIGTRVRVPGKEWIMIEKRRRNG